MIELLANGQAAADGLARPGDVVDAVDGTALAGQRLVDALVPGLPSYEVTAWRPDGGQLEAQPNATLGPGTREQPLRLELVTVRRGPAGLGLDIGDYSQVIGLVPGSLAVDDAVVRPNDVIAGVDGQCVQHESRSRSHLPRAPLPPAEQLIARALPRPVGSSASASCRPSCVRASPPTSFSSCASRPRHRRPQQIL